MYKDYLTVIIIPLFNIVFGTFCILTGFKIYKPFRKEIAEAHHKKYDTFFKIGGFGMLIWGIVNLISNFN